MSDGADGLQIKSRPYPYLVIRWMATVYGTADIRVVREDVPHPADRALTVVDPDYLDGEAMTVSLRRRIIEAAVASCQRDGIRRCVVFGEADAVYVEPDGRTHGSTTPPSGGVRLDEVLRP